MTFTKHQKLLNTGWQSWSTSAKSSFKFPLCNFRPNHKKGHFNFPFMANIKFKKPSYGWCSWYAYGWDINEKKILSNAKWIAENKTAKKLPLDYILIDAGWSVWGDWMDENRKKFTKGLKNTSKKIKELGLKPGIWIAPFLVHPKSKVANENKDWFVRENGNLVDGLKLTPWDRIFPYKKWILDVKNPKVLKYLEKSIAYLIEECGFELLKLDFLYGLHFDPSLKGEEADKFLRDFLLRIKRKYPKVYTIGCGCPLLPAINTVDSMRIGPDSIITPFLKFISLPFLSQLHISKSVIPTIMRRVWTKEFWNIDPDAFVCRGSIGLSHKQLLQFQKVVKIANGNIFLGDDLTRLSDDRIGKYLSPLFT